MSYEKETDAELEKQFAERNQNLKETWNNAIDKVDSATTSVHETLRAQQSATDPTNTTSTMRTSDADVYGGHPTSSFFDPSVPQQTGVGLDLTDQRAEGGLSRSATHDIVAMRSTDPLLFEEIASKIDETFGGNLV